MMGLLITLFLAFRLRKSLIAGADDTEGWQQKLTTLMAICGVLILVGIPEGLRAVVNIIGYVLMIGLFYVTYKEPVFQTQRNYLITLVPLGIFYFITNLVKIIAQPFYQDYKEYFTNAERVAWVWVLATFIMYNRQRKAMKSMQEIREKEMREYRLNAMRKAELEVLVNERTNELVGQNEKLKHALDELSAAQKQLIHSEKMASLGELTAGIAHEIQNPLNFVNNFAELNGELADELVAALDQKEYSEAQNLAHSIKENEMKVAHHGKRADSIVKSMLQHSRGGSGTHEKININRLADECIRLSYHGMRAREKTFNASIETNFDETIGDITAIPEDITRVLLNICTNAFYAVLQKAKIAGQGYNPTVWLTSTQQANTVTICIKDNGGGIPADVMDKIFQPFFTTKPTGEGTGLGLSMSYDIITKGHGGNLIVESEPGNGARFQVILPREFTITSTNNI
jgi:signal transduction histidine kinase